MLVMPGGMMVMVNCRMMIGHFGISVAGLVDPDRCLRSANGPLA
jgi:hypothetical protein